MAKDAARQSNGRFGPGNNAGGRPPGARQQFCEDFVHDYNEVWQEHGKDALVTVAKNQPLEFVKAAIALQPKDIKIDTAELVTHVIDFYGFTAEDDVIEGVLHNPHEDAVLAADNVQALDPPPAPLAVDPGTPGDHGALFEHSTDQLTVNPESQAIDNKGNMADSGHTPGTKQLRYSPEGFIIDGKPVDPEANTAKADMRDAKDRELDARNRRYRERLHAKY